MSTASRYHLHFDAGTEHVLPLSFVDEFGQALDVSCYEVSGVVLQQGKRLPVKAARPSATTAVISFPVLSSGVANYRLDMTSPAGTEIPMVFGTIHVMARETEASGTGELDALEVAIPTVSEQNVTIKVLGVLDLAEFGAGIEKSVEELKAGLTEHVADEQVHCTPEEKEAWNAKLAPSAADERYGFAGSIPGQEVDGQSFSTNLYLTGNRCFAKSVDFDAAELKNPVLELNVDDKTVRFFDSYIESVGGIAFFHKLYANSLSVMGTLTGTFSGSHWGSFSGNHYGSCMLFSNIVEDFQAPGWRLDKTNSCVDFKGLVPSVGKEVLTWPMSINYALDNQKVDVVNLEVKGQTVLNPSSEDDEVLLATFKANDAARYELRLRKSDGALRLTLPGGGASIFSCNSTGKMFALSGFDVRGDFTAQSATFSGDVTTSTGIHALPLGKKTALGADAYGLSVSLDGGLQLFGNHFMLSDGWSDTALKVVNNAVGLTSTDEASLSFDYANRVYFRTMPNDGDGHGVYEFECYKWTDDSHTAKEEGYVDVRKKAAMSPTDESLLNRSENDSRYGRLADANEWSGVQTIYAPDGKYGANKIIQIRDASGEYPGYNICFRNGGSLEIFDESQDPTRHEPYFQIWRPGGNRTYACNNFCVKGTTEMRKAVTLTSSSSLTANCPATFQNEVLAMNGVKLPVGGDKANTVHLTTGSIYEGQVNALVVDGAIKTGCIVQCCHLETSGNIWALVGTESASANFSFSTTESQFVMTEKLSVPDLVIDGKTIDEIVEAKVNAILTEKGLI